MNYCFIYVVSIATWQHVGKMLCTPWLRNPLTTSRLSCLGRKAALTTIFLSVRLFCGSAYYEIFKSREKQSEYKVR
jgi:hypothetical protein